MVIRTASSPSSSPVTITVSSGSGGNRSKGLTSPIQRPLFSNCSPISAKGRRASLSRDETEVVNLNSPVDFLAYRVDLPPTPEHTFVHSSVSASRTTIYGDAKINVSTGGSEISKTIFTGRFDCKARGRVMERSTDGSQVKKSELVCGMEGCDESIGKGNVKCECGFRICMGCYRDCVANDGGRCPGCKEFLSKDNDGDDDYSEEDEEEAEDKALPLPSLRDTKLEKRLSVVKSFRGYAANDFDNARWLYETQGTYGYGNAHWPKDMNESDSSADWIRNFGKKCQRPLTRKIRVSTAIISPYRLLILIRLVALALFLTWRIKNPNPEAIWLSFLSIACEIWFAFSWLLDQLPKLCPVNRVADTSLLKELFESPNNNNPRGLSDLPGIDVFVSTADPEKEPPLVTANTVLSILAADYPVEKIACYISDDGGSLLTFEALAEAATFAKLWVPFCRKHQIEPRNPEAYFGQKGDFLKNKVRRDFVQDRKRVKRQYDEFKVRINGLPESIRRRSEAFNVRDELVAKKRFEEIEPEEPTKIPKATWMEDGFHWPGTWSSPGSDHSRGDHAGIIQTMLLPASGELLFGTAPPEEGPESEKSKSIDTTGVDIRLPMLVYVSREKRPGYDHNKKAGAMNALVRASAVLSNGPFILNLDCDHYIYNSQAIREGMCFMLDRGGDRICYVQFPQRFEGIDPNDRYANHNTVFFDVSMKSLDGLQGPMYVGTGCIFRRTALYGFSPPRTTEHHGWFGTRKLKLLLKKPKDQSKKQEDQVALRIDDGQNNDDDYDASDIESLVQSRRFGSSTLLVESIPVAEYQGRLLNGIHNYKGYQGRPAGSLAVHPQPLDSSAVAEAINVISCSFEERTEWGKRVGWIYGSVTEDVVTGYRMHNRGWRSVYCVTKRDAFRGTAPINLTDRLHQVLRWATGSVEIFFSRNNALFATRRMKFLQRVAYFNVGMYPFTSIFLVLYCFLPAVSLFTGHFIVQSLNVTFLLLLLIITLTLCALSLLEIKWSGITLHDWWRNEQFWLIGGTSAHPVAVLQGLLKVLAGVEISFTLTSKSAVDEDDEFAELYEFKWTSLMYLPITIIMVNLIGITVGVTRTVYSIFPQWSKLIGGVFFSLWVLTHLYPFAKGLMGRRGKIPTIIFLWSGLISIIFSMFWVYGFSGDQTFWKFQFP